MENWTKRKEGFSTALTTVIKKDHTTSIRRHAKDYAIFGFLENKTNTTSNPNIGSYKIAIEEEWNKMSEEFILKACKSFQMSVC